MKKVYGAALFAAVLLSPVFALPVLGASAVKGKEVYDVYCIVCHGANMVNSGARAYDLRKFPLSQKRRFIEAVKMGKNQMPAWRDILSAQEIENLWAYTKTRGK